jgi:hypothetical protein
MLLLIALNLLHIITSFKNTFNEDKYSKKYDAYKLKFNHHGLLYILGIETNYNNYRKLQIVKYSFAIAILVFFLIGELIASGNNYF